MQELVRTTVGGNRAFSVQTPSRSLSCRTCVIFCDKIMNSGGYLSNPHKNSLLKAYSLASKLTFLLVLLSGVFVVEAAGGESSCPVPVLPPYRDPSPHSYGGVCPSVGRRARGDGGGCDSHVEGENKNLLSVHTVYLTDLRKAHKPVPPTARCCAWKHWVWCWSYHYSVCYVSLTSVCYVSLTRRTCSLAY